MGRRAKPLSSGADDVAEVDVRNDSKVGRLPHLEDLTSVHTLRQLILGLRLAKKLTIKPIKYRKIQYSLKPPDFGALNNIGSFSLAHLLFEFE